MNRPTLIETVSAYGRLLEFSANKRYGLLENTFSNSPIDVLALQLNKEIREVSGLDVIEEEDNFRLSNYEDVVDQMLTDFTYRYIIRASESDEAKLLQASYEIPTDFTRRFDIRVSEQALTSLPTKLFTIPTIINLSRTSYKAYACNFGDDKPRDIFLNSSIKILGKERIVFMHLSEVVRYEGFLPKPPFWSISTAVVLSTEKYLPQQDHPVKLFLKLIEQFGIPITISETKKSFFFMHSVPKNFSPNDVLLDINFGKASKATFSLGLFQTQIGVHARCAYALDCGEIVKEIKY